MSRGTLAGASAAYALGKSAPIARARLIVHPASRTSQRSAIDKLQADQPDAFALFGGNGSGKTRVAAQLAVAAALGSRDQDVQHWMRANGVSNKIIPPDGGTVILSSLTSPLSRLQMRPVVDEYAALKGGKWSNRNGEGAASLTFDANSRRRIVFLANDAGWRVFQAYQAVLVVLDEEHDQAVFDESLERVLRTSWPGGRGFVFLAMTPLKGMTWPYHRFVSDETRSNGFSHYTLRTYDNTYLDVNRYKKADQSRDDVDLARRREGQFVSSSGRVYPTFSPATHVVDVTAIDGSWQLFGGVDYGVANPLVFLLIAYDHTTKTLIVLDEHSVARLELSEHERRIHDMARKWTPDGTLPEVHRVIYDPSAGVKCGFGWPSQAGKKEVSAGIEAVKERLRVRENGRPGLLINRRCKILIDQLTRYHWAEMRKNDYQPDQPVKIDDHTVDALRYVAYDLRRW